MASRKPNGLNRCCYGTESFYTRCNFSIYQSRKGTVRILLGDSSTDLTLAQINDLGIDVYSLSNFDYDLFKKNYDIK